VLKPRQNSLAFSLVLSAFAAGGTVSVADAESDGMTRFPELEANVAFWTDVFGKYASSELIFHDPYQMDVVYGIRDVSHITDRDVDDSVKYREVREYISKEVDRIGASIRHLAHSAPRTASEERIKSALAKFGGDMPSYSEVSRRVRGQRGLADRLCGSYSRAHSYFPQMKALLAKHGVPEELSSLPLVESGYQVGAHSHKGAVGVWQFTRGTGRRFLHIDHVVDERRDPILATEAAAKYLRENYERLGTWPLAITAYNHGANGMSYAVRKLGTEDLGVIVEEYKGRSFGFASRNFYSEFLAANEVMKGAAKRCDVSKVKPFQRDEYRLDAYVPLEDLARSADIEESELIALNPALARDVASGRLRVPKDYNLYLPVGSAKSFRASYAKLPASVRYRDQPPYYATHYVKRGETLSEIAKAYRTSVSALQYHNGLRDPRYLRYGQRLKVPVAGAAAATVHAPAGGSRPASVRVARGETLSHIAKRYKMSVSSLQSINGISNPSKVHAGQLIRLTSSSGGGSTRTHRVREGQTLSHIAKQYKVSVASLQRANGIRDASRVRTGQVVRLPSSAGSGASQTHRVGKGQTLSHIAKRYRTTVSALQLRNGIADPHDLRYGQVIKIP
jgi:membrane-bound lytic murein transglycosylase D